MSLENKFSIRPYDFENDLAALSRLLTAIEAIDQDGEATSEEYLRSMQEWTNFDPDRNAWVAELDGRLVGFGQVLPRTGTPGALYVVVHPGLRRQGLGGQLLKLALARLVETGAVSLLVYANGKNQASNAFLQKRGFEIAGTSGAFSLPVGDLPPAEFPPGYSVRRFVDLANPELVVKALNDCYRDMIGHHQQVTSADRYINYYGADGIHLLFDPAGALSGICAGRPEAKTDERGLSDILDAPGLIQPLRHQGLQRPLTLAVAGWLRAHGLRPITLEYWGDDEHALDCYRAIGFELITRQITYQKSL